MARKLLAYDPEVKIRFGLPAAVLFQLVVQGTYRGTLVISEDQIEYLTGLKGYALLYARSKLNAEGWLKIDYVFDETPMMAMSITKLAHSELRKPQIIEYAPIYSLLDVKERMQPALEHIKQRARRKVSYAKRKGWIVPRECIVCGAKKVHAHHEDYSRPLDVEWLCPKHHRALHAKTPVERI